VHVLVYNRVGSLFLVPALLSAYVSVSMSAVRPLTALCRRLSARGAFSSPPACGASPLHLSACEASSSRIRSAPLSAHHALMQITFMTLCGTRHFIGSLNATTHIFSQLFIHSSGHAIKRANICVFICLYIY